MDNSSRNIVKFIAAITLATLLLMAARFYAESRKEPMPVIAEKAPDVAIPLTDEGILDESETDLESREDAEVEEVAERIMGEPSMNLETVGAPSYSPSALAEPSVEQQSAPE